MDLVEVVNALRDRHRTPISVQILQSADKVLQTTPTSEIRVSCATADGFKDSFAEAWRGLNKALEQGDVDDFTIEQGRTVAAFGRDLVAGVRQVQEICLVGLPDMVQCLLACSSFSRMGDDRFILFTRTAVQGLCNLVTSNDTNASHLWTYLTTHEAAGALVPRLLATRDTKLLTSVCILILNSIYNSQSRCQILATSSAGSNIVTAMLEQMETLLEDEQGRAFEIITSIVASLVAQEMFVLAFEHQSSSSSLLSPSQKTFLKVLDAQKPPPLAHIPVSFLLTLHHTLTSRLLALVPAPTPTPAFECVTKQPIEPTPSDAGIWEGVVLVSGLVGRWAEGEVWGSKELEEQIVDGAVSLLRGAPLLFPKATAGREDPLVPPTSRPRTPLTHLQIALLSLLSTLSFGPRPHIQNQVRVSDGVISILSLTALKEDAPFVREHALFLLRNLLVGNKEIQRVVEELQPVGRVSGDGVVEVEGVRKDRVGVP